MRKYNEMNAHDRRSHHVITGEVLSATNTTVTVRTTMPNGKEEVRLLFYSGSGDLKEGDCIDYMPFMNGNHVGYTVLGLTLPEYL